MTLYNISNKQFREACAACEIGNGDFFAVQNAFHEIGSFNRNAKENKCENADFHYYTFYQKEIKELAKLIKGNKTAKFAFDALSEASKKTYIEAKAAGLTD